MMNLSKDEYLKHSDLAMKAKWEIRAVATEIREQLATIAPNIFGSSK
jgi:thymidylate synthase ThyX